nr:hypothetical protein [Lentzea waywayandensis]
MNLQALLADLIDQLLAHTFLYGFSGPHEQMRQCLEQVVFSDIGVPRFTVGTPLGAGEAMPASIASSPMNPVPVHSPTTKSTYDEASQQIAPSLAVLGRPRHPHPLNGDEGLVIDEWLVGDSLGHLPLADRVVPQHS